MIVESGSQNASRIPGLYVYPSYEYSNQSVAPVTKIRGGTHFSQKTGAIPGDPEQRPALEIKNPPHGVRPTQSAGLAPREVLVAKLNEIASDYERLASGGAGFAKGLSVDLHA